MEEASVGRLGVVGEQSPIEKPKSNRCEGFAEFLERDLTVVSEIAEGPLHQKYDVPGHAFQVSLIGKDGHTIGNWSKPISSEELFSIIDAMPMRRDEIRKKTKS
jgi:uncharacterized protein DUF4174